MRSKRRKNKIFWFFLLALLCIGTVELIACSYFDPQLFHSITDPVIAAVTQAARTTADAVSSAAQATVQGAATLGARIEQAVEEAAAEAQRRREEKRAQLEAATQSEEPVDIAAPTNQATTPPLLKTSSDICDPAVTELQTHGDQQILTGGPVEIDFYLQGDSRWANSRYGSDKISSHGCGPTAMAMVISSLTGLPIDPPTMARWAVDNGHWARHSGSYHSIVIDAATAHGLEAHTYTSRNVDEIRNALFSGKLLVALMGPGHFTQSGHFIVLRGVTLSGDILVADPASLDRSLTSWDPQLILDELSTSTAHGSPLWIISAPSGSEFD